MVTVPTTCPFCACGCGLFLQARDGALVGTAPGESHPVAAGKMCARGWNAHEAPLWGARLLRPMVRRDGELKVESWDAVLDYVGSRLRGLLAEGKQVGILGSARATNEENYLAGRLARAGLETNHIDFSHHASVRPLILGVEDVTGEHARGIRLLDIEASDAIVVVEGDLARTHPRAASSVLNAARRGARLVVIGYARTQLARLASSFIETSPGSEGKAINSLLAAAMRTDGVAGYDSLRCELEAVTVSEQAAVAAGWIAAAGRAAFLMGPCCGPPELVRGAAASLATLAAVTGHLGRPDSGLMLLLGRSNVRGACDMGATPDRLPGYRPIADEPARRGAERLWGKTVPRAPGLDAQSMLETVSGLIVVADDPVAVLPKGERARAALERLEFLAVLDAFVTPAVERAHAVLPIASLAETEGTLTNMEGRVQRVRPAASPPGMAREGWKALSELSARLGTAGRWTSAADVLREIAQAVPRYAEAIPEMLNDGWGSALLRESEWTSFAVRVGSTEAPTSPERRFVLARDCVLDWGADPLVRYSPTLCRDYQAERKLFSSGLVEMNAEDADAIGVRSGWRVKLSSDHGAAAVAVRLRKDLERGVLLAPCAFRDWLAGVLGEDGIAAADVERA